MPSTLTPPPGNVRGRTHDERGAGRLKAARHRAASLLAPGRSLVVAWRKWANAASHGQRTAALLAVAAVAAWNLWSFRATVLPVSYLYDASVHSELVRFATSAIEAGRDPYGSWFPYIGLGSGEFLHYQSLAAVLTGIAGTVIGPGTAFRWSTYLLVSLWPFAIYASARLFGFKRPAATASALLSPFVVSYTGIAFERGAYSWTGGAQVWTQLFGSWALVLALPCCWRALKDSRYIWRGAVLSGLTIALHFMCGYLALLGIVIFALAAEGRLGRRLARSIVIFAGSLLAAAWVLVPLVALSKWASIDEPLANTPYVKGYGARQELAWLFTGQLFDARRALPVISVAVAIGVLIAVARWKSAPLTRSVLAFGAASFVLSFGRTTFGPLFDLVPAHADLFFRRFQMGAQLAGVLLAGSGVVAVWEAWKWLLARASASHKMTLPTNVASTGGPVLRGLAAVVFLVAMVAWFWPAGAEIAKMDSQDASAIAHQRAADAQAAPLVAPLLAYVKSHGGGRVYAGLSGNWGGSFRVGYVPVFKYLEEYDIDEVSYLVPTSSLMLSPEANFDEYNTADYALFGARYILLPTGASPPVPAAFVMSRGQFSLWRLPHVGYASLVRVTGSVAANRANVGARTAAFLDFVGLGEDWAVAWPGNPSSPLVGQAGSTAGGRPGRPLGTVQAVANLDVGTMTVRARADQATTLLASISYSPLWHAWVDGHPVRTEMLAPAVLGVPLQPGEHLVVLRYTGFGWYPELWALSVLSVVGLWALGRRRRLRQAN